MFSPSVRKTNHKCHHQEVRLNADRRTASLFAVCGMRARPRPRPGPGTGPGTGPGARLFVLIGGGGARAGPGRRLGAGLGPGGGPAAGLAPS